MVRLAARRPGLMLGIALLLVVPALHLASRLRLNTDLGRLLPRHSRAVLAKQELERATGDGGYFSILFEGDDHEALRRAVETTAARVAALPGVQSVSFENPVEFLRKYRYLLVPSLHLQGLIDHIDALEAKVNPLVEDLGEDEAPKPDAGGADVERTIERYLDLPQRHQSPDGRLMGMIIRTEKGVTRLGEIRALFRRLEETAAQAAAEQRVWAGVGGSHRNKVDVYDQVRRDLTRSGSLALLGIVAVLVLSFRSLRILPVVLLPLVAGLAWGYAIVPWLVEDLNTITSFLLMVLFGTGVEYAVHLVSRFQAELETQDAAGALAVTFRSTGRSILTSGLATTLGMAVLIVSRFRGFSEFGVIAGVGSLAIFAAMFTVLPPLLVLGARWGWIRPRRVEGPRRFWVPGKVPTLGLGAASIVGGAFALALLSFDFDFTRLQTDSMETEAIKQKHRLVYPGFTVPGALYVAHDLPALDQALARLEARKDAQGPNPTFASITSVRDFVPDAAEMARRRERLAEIKDRLAAPWTRRIKDERVRRWIQDLRDFHPPETAPTVDELPLEIQRRIAARDGSGEWLLSVDMAGRSRDGLQSMAFTRELYALTMPPGVRGPTGDKPVLAEILWLVTGEGPWLVGLTLLGVFVLVFIDRHSLIESFWVLLPLYAGLGLTLGTMVLLGWKLNFFNIVVLPNLIGNAVDNGVHYFRRWKETGGDVRAVQQELAGPLTTSVATTLMGYGGLLVANHAGLRSIGALAVLGLACCWLTGVALMPGVLALLSTRARGLTARPPIA
jgi:predicted RND superfamily exporter protein